MHLHHLTNFVLASILPFCVSSAPSPPNPTPTPVPNISLLQQRGFKIPDHINVTYVYPNGTTSTNQNVEYSNILRKRGGISLYVCTEVNFAGSCILVNFLASGSTMLLTNTIFDKHVKSCGPEAGVTCNLFADRTHEGQCTGKGFFQLTYPGIQDLSRVRYPGPSFASGQPWEPATRGWDNILTCVQCWGNGDGLNTPGNGGGGAPPEDDNPLVIIPITMSA